MCYEKCELVGLNILFFKFVIYFRKFLSPSKFIRNGSVYDLKPIIYCLCSVFYNLQSKIYISIYVKGETLTTNFTFLNKSVIHFLHCGHVYFHMRVSHFVLERGMFLEKYRVNFISMRNKVSQAKKF